MDMSFQMNYECEVCEGERIVKKMFKTYLNSEK